MTIINDDLVQRLLASRAQWKDAKSVPTDLESEAAARIIAVEAERDEALALVNYAEDVADFHDAIGRQWHSRATTAEARIVVLEAEWEGEQNELFWW
jgi:hypothetical protein